MDTKYEKYIGLSQNAIAPMITSDNFANDLYTYMLTNDIEYVTWNLISSLKSNSSNTHSYNSDGKEHKHKSHTNNNTSSTGIDKNDKELQTAIQLSLLEDQKLQQQKQSMKHRPNNLYPPSPTTVLDSNNTQQLGREQKINGQDQRKIMNNKLLRELEDLHFKYMTDANNIFKKYKAELSDILFNI